MRVLLLSLLLLAPAQAGAQTSDTDGGDFLEGIRASIVRHLGKPYVWGATGTKSFDCSGFLWRVLFENGVLVKRTTARKFYMMLPKVREEDHGKFGTIIFFDTLKHVGIVNGPGSFYHAQVSRGTNLSPLNPYWKAKVHGFRALPAADR
jgi:cell wall-associated NlpC family hydrolase